MREEDVKFWLRKVVVVTSGDDLRSSLVVVVVVETVHVEVVKVVVFIGATVTTAVDDVVIAEV